MIRRRNKAGRFSTRGRKWTRDDIHGIIFTSKLATKRARLEKYVNVAWLLHFSYLESFRVDVVVYAKPNLKSDQLINIARKYLPKNKLWIISSEFFDGLSEGPVTNKPEDAEVRSFKRL